MSEVSSRRKIATSVKMRVSKRVTVSPTSLPAPARGKLPFAQDCSCHERDPPGSIPVTTGCVNIKHCDKK
jgi:hypothetical protein